MRRKGRDFKMAKIVMGIKLSQRIETAKALQDILSRHGCIINTRLGFHEASSCSNEGYILLTFTESSDDEVEEMQNEIEALGDISVKTMEL